MSSRPGAASASTAMGGVLATSRAANLLSSHPADAPASTAIWVVLSASWLAMGATIFSSPPRGAPASTAIGGALPPLGHCHFLVIYPRGRPRPALTTTWDVALTFWASAEDSPLLQISLAGSLVSTTSRAPNKLAAGRGAQQHPLLHHFTSPTSVHVKSIQDKSKSFHSVGLIKIYYQVHLLGGCWG